MNLRNLNKTIKDQNNYFQALCLYYLGLCYENGYGVTVNKETAIKYYNNCSKDPEWSRISDTYKALAEIRLAKLEQDKALYHYQKSNDYNYFNIIANHYFGYYALKDPENGEFAEELALEQFKKGYDILKYYKNELNNISMEDFLAFDKEIAIDICVTMSQMNSSPHNQFRITSYDLRPYHMTDKGITKVDNTLINENIIDPLRLAIELGSKDAYYQLGVMLLKYSYPAEESTEAFKKAMEYGSMDGAYEYARSLILGRGIEKNYEEGVLILSDLIKKEYPKAYHEFGVIGIKEGFDFEGISSLLNKAGKLGCAESYYLLGRLYKDKGYYFKEQWTTEEYPKVCIENARYVLKEDNVDNSTYSKYVKYMDKAASLGYPDAYFELYKSTKDRSKAMDFLIKAKDLGCTEALNKLAYILYTIDKDYQGAAKLYKISACRGNANGMYHLGIMKLNGKDIDQNTEFSLSLLRESSYLGYGKADLALAECYRNGTGVKADKNEAIKYYNKYLEAYWDGYYELGKYYYEIGDYEKAISLFKQAIAITEGMWVYQNSDTPSFYNML